MEIDENYAIKVTRTQRWPYFFSPIVPFSNEYGEYPFFLTQRANLKGMINGDNISVSKVIHKAVVEVNEEGTEAAAVTGIGITFM